MSISKLSQNGLTDFPRVKNFDRQTVVDLETPSGIIKFYPLHPTPQHGVPQNHLSILGYSESKLQSCQQGIVQFGGQQFTGTFSDVTEMHGLWKATLEADIPVPEYWQK